MQSFILLCGLAAVLYGIITSRQILSLSSGNDKMQEIAKAIPDATALFSKYTSLAIELHKDHKEEMKSFGGYTED